jgi:hypothetical protein
MTEEVPGGAAAFIETALTEVCFGSAGRYPLDATIDRYFTADYQQCTDGEIVDRAGFARHIAAVRAVAVSGQVTVREAVREGDRIADRHEVTVTKRDGSTSRVEVYLFGQFASDGRLRRVDEVSRLLDGDQADAHLARLA